MSTRHISSGSSLFPALALPPIPRKTLETTICEAVKKHPRVVLCGPYCSGKTWLLKRLQEGPLKEVFDGSIIYLNCFSLRSDNHSLLDSEAIRILEARKNGVLATLDVLEETLPDGRFDLFSYLQHKMGKKGLLILDHGFLMADQMGEKYVGNVCPRVREWREGLLTTMVGSAYHVLYTDESSSVSSCPSGTDPSSPFPIRIPPVDRSEIVEWLSSKTESGVLPDVSAADALLAATGGMVWLLRDLGYHLQAHPGDLQTGLQQFSEEYGGRYHSAVHRVFRTIANHPEELPHWDTTPSNQMRREILLSGAFLPDGDGGVKAAAPPLQKRLDTLLEDKKNNLLLAAAHCPLDKILAGNLPLEVVLGQFSRYLYRSPHHAGVMQDMLQFLKKIFQFEATVYFRDEHHMLIWHEFSEAGLRFPVEPTRTHFIGERKSHLADVIISGWMRQVRDEGETSLFFPIIGPSGLVDLVLQGTVPEWFVQHPWQRRLHVRDLWSSLLFLETALSRAINGFYRQRTTELAKRITTRLDAITLKKGDLELTDILDTAPRECCTLAVLVKVGSHETAGARSDGATASREIWIPRMFRARKAPGSGRFFYEESHFILNQDAEELCRFARQHTSKGIVVASKKGKRLFPELYKGPWQPTLFLKTVDVEGARDKEQSLLVLFVFHSAQGKECPVILDWFDQRFLTILALRLGRMEYQRVYPLDSESDRTTLFDAIHRATSLALEDPTAAEETILQAFKAVFQVSTVSLSDVVTKEGQKKVIFRHGLGYADSYAQHQYECDSDQEGKTGYIASSGSAIVVWNDSTASGPEHSYTFQVADESRINNLTQLPREIRGRDQCTRHVQDKKIWNFFGAPVCFGKTRDGQKQVIGVFKMANRRNSAGPLSRFSNGHIELAQAACRALGPALYFLQKRREILAGGLPDAIRFWARGIRHQLDNEGGTSLGERLRPFHAYIPETEREAFAKLCASADSVKHLGSWLDNVADEAWTNNEEHVPVEETIVEFLEELDALDDSWKPAGCKINRLGLRDAMICMPKANFVQVIKNVLRNAGRAMQGRPNPKLTIKSQLSGSAVEILIQDNGPGLSENAKERLFRPFYSSWQTGAKGQGVGLALAWYLVIRAGGDIRHAALSPGTQFTILLPRWRWDGCARGHTCV